MRVNDVHVYVSGVVRVECVGAHRVAQVEVGREGSRAGGRARRAARLRAFQRRRAVTSHHSSFFQKLTGHTSKNQLRI